MAENVSNRLFGMDAAAKFFGLDLIKYEDCAMWVVTELHPHGGACPHCTGPIKLTQLDRYFRLQQIRCSWCSKKFTGATGTLLNTSKLEVREIYLIAVLSHLGVPAARIASQLRIHVDTVTNWQDHFRAQQELASA